MLEMFNMDDLNKTAVLQTVVMKRKEGPGDYCVLKCRLKVFSLLFLYQTGTQECISCSGEQNTLIFLYLWGLRYLSLGPQAICLKSLILRSEYCLLTLCTMCQATEVGPCFLQKLK